MGEDASVEMNHHPREFRFNTDDLKSIWRPALILWGIFLAVWLFISLSRLGLQHDVVGLSWGPAGTPITFLQVVLALIVSVVLTSAWTLVRSRLSRISSFLFSIKDILIFVALWALAVFLWSNQPASPTHFSPPSLPPNHETYPNSDALLFDRSSHHLLYGIGFADRLVRRPLYVGALALFHKVAGGNYDDTIFLQMLVLALIPALLYLFTSKISNRMAGLIAGCLIILRERNSIQLSGEIVTSHAKLMMSDMLATFGVLLVLYLTVRWLFKKKPAFLEYVIVGACLGLTALIRAQVLILVLPLFLFILLSKKPFPLSIKNSLLVLLGIILAVTPWAWRNWNLTGTFVLDDRGEERLLARNYSLSPLSMPSPSPGETEDEFSARLKMDILTFIRSHPAEVIHFVSNHFLRNLATSSVYIAPAYSTASPAEVIQHLPFWDDWNGKLTRNSMVALFLNLGLIALGVGVASAKNKWIGIFPLVIFLVYSFGNALVRSSGWRFNQPADWIMLVYYSTALAYLPSKIKFRFGENSRGPTIHETKVKSFVPELLTLLTLLLLGASVPIAERLIPVRDFDGFTDEAKAKLSNENILSRAELDRFLQQENAIAISGIGLYPRFIRPNSRFQPVETDGEFEYLHLWLMNEGDRQVVLPIQDAPSDIPHTATISVIGCQMADYISAFAIIVHEPSAHIIIRDPGAALSCPLSEP